jgi:putative resolvase
MKLSTWAKKQGICYKTAWRWASSGKMPVPCVKTETGLFLVCEPEIKPSSQSKAGIYARVSSQPQKADLERQVERIKQFASANGYIVEKVVAEIASGLNDKRKGLLSLLTDTTIDVIICEHTDRLARFGTNTIEAMLNAYGRKLIVIDKTELNNDIVKDLVDIITCFCAKIYGKRSGKNKAKKLIEQVQSENNTVE